MELARRTRWIALSLPVAMAAAAALARPAPPGVLAAAGPVAERACAQEASADGDSGEVSGGAWYRLDPTLDARGTLVGRVLTAGRGSARWTAELPPESFASGPVGGRVLVGDDDGHRSRLRLFDTRRGCWSAVGSEASVIRSALLTADASGLYEHRVDRATRRDLGVWQRDGREPGHPRRVLPGLEPSPAYGPTFSTTLVMADDGRLTVSSCGELACRTRVLDPATGTMSTAEGTGPAAGVVGDRLVALEACDGLPCPVRAIDLASGAASALGGGAMGVAVIATGGSGLVVVPGERGLHVVRARDAARTADVPDTSGLAPVPRTSTSETGFEAPRGLVAVAPGGSAADSSLIRLLDPASLQITAGEVLP
ncbi:MAG: hypothetical protein ACYDAN_02260 [Candidatus Limnocylindrales bacterium]